jgi:uncharacterized small protein (DUF1192 family)
METNHINITSPKSLANLIALWQSEADRRNAERTEGKQTWVATAQSIGYGYCSDYFKYEAGNGIRPRWMCDYPVDALALEFATMYRDVNEAEAREAALKAEEKRGREAAMQPSPAFTIGDLCAI